MQYRNSHRAAYSLLDLLVLLALVILVGGVSLPGLQALRTANARTQCADNFKRIGSALHGFADSHHGGLPPIGGGPSPSLFIRLLPYVGHEQLARGLADSGLPWHDPANAERVKTRLAVYQCPAAPNPERVLKGNVKGAAFEAAPTDYNGINQITNAIAYLFPEDLDRTAALHSSEAQPLSSITDGLSNTLSGVVEIADKPNGWRAGKLTKPGGQNRGAGGTWAGNTFNSPRGYSLDGATAPGPCAMNCANTAAVYSFHPEGCNFLFADGSVRFLRRDLNVWIFYAVITRRGGEVLSPADF